MVYAWELWQTRHERLRERQERKQAELVEQLLPVVREQLRPVMRGELLPEIREELRDELRKWLDEGRRIEDWLNGHPQGNGSQPEKP